LYRGSRRDESVTSREESSTKKQRRRKRRKRKKKKKRRKSFVERIQIGEDFVQGAQDKQLGRWYLR